MKLLPKVTLESKFTQQQGRIYVSGTQALVRLLMLQKERDQCAGFNTAGYVSGYRGSPLGALDLALWRAKTYLKARDIVFEPGLNEDLAATALWGTQQVNLFNSATRDGVFGMWYGKGPGLDRSADVFKHANSAGSSKHGGVLVLAGDDHAAKSSTLAHQSEHLLKACGLPVLYPSNVQEYLDFGLHGWAMSRFCGLWVAMKCVTDVVESSASVEIDTERVQVLLPKDFVLPPDGLNLRWPDSPLAQEARMFDFKWYAALEYVRVNRLNRIVINSPHARFGIMAAGKAYLDVRQALTDLGLDESTCERIGIRVFKIGCVWPLEAQDARAFATGLQEILVVEEKRQILEYALKEELYNWRDDVRPNVYGKFDERDHSGGEWSVPRDEWLLPARYELSPAMIAKAIATRLERVGIPEDVHLRVLERVQVIEAKEREANKVQATLERIPWFCSGCPHNTSTKVPEGSRALAGIGCHYMAIWMDRNTQTFSQMGGEGVPWLGQMHFCSDKHVFVNLGDGTYGHSGILAIRAAIAAKATITYKILFNDAVAMTGGQPVDSHFTVVQIANTLQAEGVSRIVIVYDEKIENLEGLHHSVSLRPRSAFDEVQRQLRETQGVSILIYAQTCATEKRRRRKRADYPDPDVRAFIHPDVCEGCGDCSTASNCLSVEQLPTSLGTKRQINQHTCNKDYACINGFCPSFVTLYGAKFVKPKSQTQLPIDHHALPSPPTLEFDGVYGILITGIGGTGIVTVGALLGMAAHLEQKGVTVLDMAGLAQKGGAVLSHVQIAHHPEAIYATRIATGEAHLMIGCDAIVSASTDALSKLRLGLTRAFINSVPTPTASLLSNPDWEFPLASAKADIHTSLGDKVEFFDANQLAVHLLGDSIFANLLLVGYAWQKGCIPLQETSLIAAIELNAVSVEKNLAAFRWGRYLALHPEFVETVQNTQPIHFHKPQTLQAMIEERFALLSAYQNTAYATLYQNTVERVMKAERTLGKLGQLQKLSKTVAQNLAKIMSYKDEYEVARLFTSADFFNQLRTQFEGDPGKDYTIQFHLSPPLIAKKNVNGQAMKSRYGQWLYIVMRLLAKLKFLRNSSLNPFGYTTERKMERQWIQDYLKLIDEICTSLNEQNYATAIALAQLPEKIRGYGHIKLKNFLETNQKYTELLKIYRNQKVNS